MTAMALALSLLTVPSDKEGRIILLPAARMIIALSLTLEGLIRV